MIVIGLNHGEINSSAALFSGRTIIAGAPEERFNRQKLTRLFPHQTIRYCLDFANIELSNFDVNPECSSRFMESVVPVKAKHRASLPGITLVDGSGRLLTVEAEENGRFYRIIKEVEALTGVPVVLNTSFNINGEPIVLSPDDALTTFFNSGLLYLVMDDVLVEKR